MARTVKVWNKTKTKFIKFRFEDYNDAAALMRIFARNSYDFVLYGDEEEGEDHGYKDND